MPASHLLYRLAIGSVRAVAPLLASRDTKLARGLAGRRTAHEALAAWGRRERDPARPCVWFHAPSVGESLQARAIIQALRAARPDLQCVFTHFSPSAEAIAQRMGVDVHAYLPWDLLGPVRTALDAVAPDVIVYTKTEVWPVLTAEATSRGVSTAIVAATVPPDAGRLGWAARRLLASTWSSLAVAAAIAQPDADRLHSMGVREGRCYITGDPGVDSAAQRIEQVSDAATYLQPFLLDPRPTIVAGSTWPTDEAVLLAALEAVREAVPTSRIVIAPHEPDSGGLRTLASALEEIGWATRTLSVVEAQGSAEGVDAVLVDRVGILAHLYRVGRVAYVGGGFHDAGLHSVLEPAACGLPVVIGPRHQKAGAAQALIDCGAARDVTDAESLARALVVWLADGPDHDYASAHAFGYIDAHRGAADRTAELLAALL